jgi:hypothetical protein
MIFPFFYCIKDGCEAFAQCQDFMPFKCSHQFLTKWIMWRLQSKEELSYKYLNLKPPSPLRPTTFELVEWLLHIAKKTIPWTLVVVKYVWAMPPNHFLWYTVGAQSFFIDEILSKIWYEKLKMQQFFVVGIWKRLRKISRFIFNVKVGSQKYI